MLNKLVSCALRFSGKRQGKRAVFTLRGDAVRATFAAIQVGSIIDSMHYALIRRLMGAARMNFAPSPLSPWLPRREGGRINDAWVV